MRHFYPLPNLNQNKRRERQKKVMWLNQPVSNFDYKTKYILKEKSEGGSTKKRQNSVFLANMNKHYFFWNKLEDFFRFC